MDKKEVRLLLADDDETDRELFDEAIKIVNYPVTIDQATNGEQLMNYLAQENISMPDALFLDLNMPRKNGFECLNEIKASGKWRDLPVFIMSTSLDLDVVRQLHDKGAFRYLRKPGSFKVLVEVLKRSLDLIAAGAPAAVSLEDFILSDKM